MTFERWSIHFTLPRVESRHRQVARRSQLNGIDECESLVLAGMSTATENWSRRGNERTRLSTRIRYVLASTTCLMAFFASPRASHGVRLGENDR
jgi:hypothetical protein